MTIHALQSWVTANFQGLDTDLTDLIARWIAASASAPASLDFAEDTNNGTNRLRVTAPASVAADRTLTLPDATTTLLGASNIGVSVQAFSAILDAFVALTPSNDDILQRKAGAWTNRTIAQLLTDLAAPGTTFQPLASTLTDIAARWTAASASGPASLVFLEDTDNGTNKVTLIAPASVASDRTLTMPDATGTVALTSAIPAGSWTKKAGTAVDNIASSSWVALESDGSFDITIACATGDCVVATISGGFNNEAVNKMFTVATMVAGSPVNYFHSASPAAGDLSGPWLGLASTTAIIAGSVPYVVQSGDISGGNVTFRVMARGSAGTTWTPRCADADQPLFFMIVNNHGNVIQF